MEGIRIEEDKTLKEKLLLALEKRFEERGDKIHVSELILCLRLSYFRRRKPKPPTERELSFYLDGARRHEIIEMLYGEASEVKIEKGGIVGTVDILDDYPVEFKSTRVYKGENFPEHYLRQIAFYMVLLGKREGRFIIQNLLPKKDEVSFGTFKITLSEEKFNEYKEEMIKSANLLKNALLADDPSILPGPKEDWRCRTWQYTANCLEIWRKNRKEVNDVST